METADVFVASARITLLSSLKGIFSRSFLWSLAPLRFVKRSQRVGWASMMWWISEKMSLAEGQSKSTMLRTSFVLNDGSRKAFWFTIIEKLEILAILTKNSGRQFNNEIVVGTCSFSKKSFKKCSEISHFTLPIHSINTKTNKETTFNLILTVSIFFTDLQDFYTENYPCRFKGWLFAKLLSFANNDTLDRETMIKSRKILTKLHEVIFANTLLPPWADWSYFNNVCIWK